MPLNTTHLKELWRAPAKAHILKLRQVLSCISTVSKISRSFSLVSLKVPLTILAMNFRPEKHSKTYSPLTPFLEFFQTHLLY